MPVRVFHCSICQSTEHTARNHDGSRQPRRLSADESKARNVYSHYRLEYPDYLSLLELGCSVCEMRFERTPDIDHKHGCDHFGKGHFSCRACVRGLLCRSCNLRVGAFERGLNSDADVAAYLGVPRPRAEVPQLALW